ncbi:10296_t:CDS:1, partial [Racocetra persica]
YFPTSKVIYACHKYKSESNNYWFKHQSSEAYKLSRDWQALSITKQPKKFCVPNTHPL